MGTSWSTEATFDKSSRAFAVVWFDAQVNFSKENRRAQKQLRDVVHQLTTFDRENECRQYLQSISAQERILLIVSGQSGRIIVPQMHQLHQIFSIYVYCRDKPANEQWSKQFPKVKAVVTHLNELVSQIKQEQDHQIRLEEPFSFNIYSMHTHIDRSTTTLNGHFVHSLLLIDVLLRMKTKDKDTRELIALCYSEYQNDPKQFPLIRQFEVEYSAKKALWWYTRDSFLYRILNRALRTQNIEVMYLFRCIIQDISRQLEKHQCRVPVRVYRGQIMSEEEICILRQSIHHFISINSFFSTSTTRERAVKFLKTDQLTPKFCRVLFEIDADPRFMSPKPFADISTYSAYRNEKEILFMIGCVFRLLDVHQSDDRMIWIVQMRLCSDDEHEMKNLFENMKNNYGGGNNEVNHLAFGRVLRQMGKYDLAEKFYRRLLHQISPHDPCLADLYYSLGVVIMDTGDYHSSLQWFSKSLNIILRENPFDYINIGSRYCCIGSVYWKQGDYHHALVWNQKGIELFTKANRQDHLSVAYFYNNTALVYNDLHRYNEALDNFQKASKIYLKHLPNDHPDLATLYDNIGTLYLSLGHENLALNYHNLSLKIRRKCLPSSHPLIALTYRHLGLVYEHTRQINEALTYFQQSQHIYLQSFPAQHPDVQKTEEDIERLLVPC